MKKTLGQHWLIDANVITSIGQAVSIEKNDICVEIGPGTGNLTKHIMRWAQDANCQNIYLIEKDRTLVPDLLCKFPKATTIEQDILDFPMESLVRDHSKIVVYGNLPYNISVAIMKKMIPIAPYIKSLIFLVQKEVGHRIIATQGRAYGSLSILMKLYFEVELIREVPPHSFIPNPKVDSCLLRFHPREENLEQHITNLNVFWHLITLAFSQRRKKIKSTIGVIYPHLSQAKIMSSRPEAISLQDWITLANQTYA